MLAFFLIINVIAIVGTDGSDTDIPRNAGRRRLPLGRGERQRGLPTSLGDGPNSEISILFCRHVHFLRGRKVGRRIGYFEIDCESSYLTLIAL